MATISGEQSCGSATYAAAKVGIELKSCTRNVASDNITIQFRAYLYTTSMWTTNSLVVFIDDTKYTVFDCAGGNIKNNIGQKYYTSTITKTLTVSNNSATLSVGVNGNSWSPQEAHSTFKFTVSNVPAKTYLITYNAHGGSGIPNSQTKTHGVSLTLSSTVPTRTGYTFTSWNTAAGGTGTRYNPGAQYTANANVTLYAQWQANTYTISYNANGGSGAPSSQTKTYGIPLTLSSTKPTRSGYTFTSWNTAANGSGDTYSSGDDFTRNEAATLYAQWVTTTPTRCGSPTNLSIVDNNDNTLTVSCDIGTNGTNNISNRVTFFVTYDGTAPNESNYYHTCYYSRPKAGPKATITLPKLTQQEAEEATGGSLSGITVKVSARTEGSAGSAYYSTLSASYCVFSWRSRISPPKFITPGNSTVKLSSAVSVDKYRVSWTTGTDGINNKLSAYVLSVYNLTTNTIITTHRISYNRSAYELQMNLFKAGNTYRLYLKAVGNYDGFDSETVMSSLIVVKNYSPISVLTLEAFDGGTVPSVELSNKKTYVDIGSGNVLKLKWSSTQNSINFANKYILNIVADDPNNTVILDNVCVGNIKEYYITASQLAQINQPRFNLTVTLSAISVYDTGSYWLSDSRTITIPVIKGCGTYTKVSNNYKQPIMRRSIAFARTVSDLENTTTFLVDKDGLLLKDSIDNYLVVDSGEYMWRPMQEFYLKSSNGSWKRSDVSYEVLIDADGEIITNTDDVFIYTL